MDRETLILYCDTIPDPALLNGEYTRDPFYSKHSFIGQHILDINSAQLDENNFTVSPHIETTTLDLTERTWNVRLFDEGHLPGYQSLIVIGLMGGWTATKLTNLKNWLDHPKRQFALNDPNCKIVVDYSLEGFSELVFADLWNWIHENDLDNRIVYITGAINVNDLYLRWCSLQKKQPNMICLWSGFFARNIYSSLPHTVYYEGRHYDLDYQLQQPLTHENIISKFNIQIQRYNYHPDTNNRIMCLNRRPHIHRLLMLLALKRTGIISKMSVSFPKDFNEPSQWLPPNYDKIKVQWDILKNYMVGHIDHLEKDFSDLYDNILPLIVDREDFSTNHAQNLNISMYCKHPINLITETLAFDSSVFFSEKIWKPMLTKQIFLIWSSPFYLKWIRSLGFKTFAPYINEEYDLITDDLDRARAIADECKRITLMTGSDFLKLIENCKPIAEYNQNLVAESSFTINTCQREVIEYIKQPGPRYY